MTGSAVVLSDINLIMRILVPRLSVVFGRSTGRAVATRGTLPVRVLKASIARANNAVVMRSSFRAISQVSDIVIVLRGNSYIVKVNWNSVSVKLCKF